MPLFLHRSGEFQAFHAGGGLHKNMAIFYSFPKKLDQPIVMRAIPNYDRSSVIIPQKQGSFCVTMKFILLTDFSFIARQVSRKATLLEIECSQWLSEMKRRFFRDVSPHLREQPSRHLHLPWQSLHSPSTPEDYVPC